MNIAKIMIPKISTVFLYEKDTIRQGLERFMVHGYTAVPVLNDQEQSWQFHFNPPIKEIFRPEIIAKDAAMVITPIPAILLYTPLCALNYKSKGLKKVKENAYLY